MVSIEIYMSFKKKLEQYLFKKRYIYIYTSNTSNTNKVFVLPMDKFDEALFLENIDSRLRYYLMMRKGKPEWVLFYFGSSKDIYGYSFLHIPKKTEWNDSLPTKPTEARTSASYTYPEYRGQGIRGEVINLQVGYAQKNKLKLWSVIEESNNLSLHASRKNGRPYRVNYLIKIMGRNIISILTNPFRIYLLLGDRRARR